MPPNSLCKTTYTKSYAIKGAQITSIHVTPEGDVITDYDTMRTAERTEKERVVTMSAISLGGAESSYRPPPMRRFGFNACAESERMTESSFAAEGTTSETVGEWTRARPFSTNHWKSTESD